MKFDLWPLVLLLAVIALTPWFGSEIVLPTALADPTERSIFITFRLPRLLLGLLAGSALSIAGCLFQAVLRNPLASPYTLGVSTGAALGAVIMIFLDIAWIWTGSMIGAFAALALIASVFIRQRRISATGLVLAGVSVNSVCSSFIILLQSVAGFAKSFSVTTWLVGSVDAMPMSTIALYAAVILPLMLWIIVKAPDWDLLSMGDAWAAGRGVPVRNLLVQACVAGSLLTAATVALTGPIGFVGLMVPHLVRHRTGASHRRLLPAALLCGAAFLATCDAVARTVLKPAEIPVGVVTALIGGPGLIWILRSERSEL
jgi:iron complex transport system permease protein